MKKKNTTSTTILMIGIFCIVMGILLTATAMRISNKNRETLKQSQKIMYETNKILNEWEKISSECKHNMEATREKLEIIRKGCEGQ